jgi:hypothetical protein
MARGLFLFIAIMMTCSLEADNRSKVVEDYNRSSLYTISMLHPGTGMYDQIYETMLNVSVPERFNDHNLSLRLIVSQGKADDQERVKQVEDFLKCNKVAKRLVSKWFNRDKNDGAFDMQLVKDRGNYNATIEDVNLAMQSIRGKAILEDAGEQLINNTFVLVNDITYVDKHSKADGVKSVFQAISLVGNIMSAAQGNKTSGSGSSLQGVGQLGDAITSLVAGFTVRMKSHLFQLVWNDSIAGTFYSQYYYDKNTIDQDKKRAYLRDNKLFQLKYVGSYEATSSKTVLHGLKNNGDVFMKVLTRAIDENIVQLRKKFEIFKITAPLYEIASDGMIHIHIGLKEGVSSSSKNEVLERLVDDEGRITYHRKGVIRPVKGKIWDNRFMATEEGADGANLNFTSFEVVSGKDFYPGMLVREIK